MRGPKVAVVPTYPILIAADVVILGGGHVFALHDSPEEWQAASLLERGISHDVGERRAALGERIQRSLRPPRLASSLTRSCFARISAGHVLLIYASTAQISRSLSVSLKPGMSLS